MCSKKGRNNNIRTQSLKNNFICIKINTLPTYSERTLNLLTRFNNSLKSVTLNITI